MIPESTKDPQNMSIVELENSPSSVEKIDYLIVQCETLMENNVTKYDKCVIKKEELRLQILEANENHAYSRLWLENGSKDCLTMKPKYGHLSRTYKILLKNNFAHDFVEHGEARGKLNLNFLSVVMQVDDLEKSLNKVNDEMKSLKSEYEEIDYREILYRVNSTEKPLEHVKLLKELRLKSVDVTNELERLNSYLNEIGDQIVKLTAEHEDLTRSYRVLLQDPIVKEFFDYAKYQEKLHLKLAEKSEGFECVISSHDKASYENVSSINVTEYKKKLDQEQRQREQIEKENYSLNDFSDKLCLLLYKYQGMISSDKTAQKFTTKSTQNLCAKSNPTPAVSDLIVSASEIEENNIEMDTHENGIHFMISSAEKENYLPVNEKNGEKFDFAESAQSMEVVGNSDGPKENETRESVIKILSSSSNKLEISPSKIQKQKPSPVIKILRKPIRRLAKMPASAVKKCNPIGKFPQLRAVSNFYCNICDRYYASAKSLRAHKRSIHESLHQQLAKQAKCTICGKIFSSRASIPRHVLTVHTSLRPFKCMLCPRKYNDPSALAKHLRVNHEKS